MELDFQALGIAFATGWFANWSYGQWHNWYLRRKRAKGAYITVSHLSGGIDFEGRAETRNLSATYLYDDAEYQISVKIETGKAKKEVKIPLKGGDRVAKSHDIAARRIARIHGGKYRRSKSPDVKGPGLRVEVKSRANEIPEAQRQLAGGGPAYIALPKPEHKEALRRLKHRKTGLMNYQGKIIKPSTRK